eukprot:402880-Amphidinium_carterae.1
MPSERLDHGGLDEVTALAMSMENAIRTVNEAWKDAKLEIRTLDLRHAYKQLAIASEDLKVAVKCMFDAGRSGASSWQNSALHFGATVHVREWWLPAISTTSWSWNLALPLAIYCVGDAVLEGLLQAIGWLYDKEGDKYMSYSMSAEVLGARIQLGSDELVIGNTERRITYIMDEVNATLMTDSWKAADASKLAGRLTFFRSFTSGRHLHVLMWDLHQRAAGAAQRSHLTVEEEKSLALILEYLQGVEPRTRTVQYGREVRPVILYTDGAIEAEYAGAGAVFVPGEVPRVWARELLVEVQSKMIAEWGKRTRHAVAEAELLPAV